MCKGNIDAWIPFFFYISIAAPSLHGNLPTPKARMSVSLNTTTNVAWFYGGRTESSQTQAANYVRQN